MTDGCPGVPPLVIVLTRLRLGLVFGVASKAAGPADYWRLQCREADRRWASIRSLILTFHHVTMLRIARRTRRTFPCLRTVEGWWTLRNGGRPGPSEGKRNCGDRATAPIEDIWCEKIRGCSIVRLTPYRLGPSSGSAPAPPPSVIHLNEDGSARAADKQSRGRSVKNDLASARHSPRRYHSQKAERLAKCTRTRKAVRSQERTPGATLAMTIAAATRRPAQSQTTSGPTR